MATEIRTSSGFCCEIDEAAINDMELLEDLEELDRGNPLQVPSALRRLLGEQGKRALCDHLRTESGRVPVDKVSVELAEIFGGLKSKKIILLAQMLNAGEDELVCDFAGDLSHPESARPARAVGGHAGMGAAAGRADPAQNGGTAGTHGDTAVGGRGGPSLSAAVAEDGERAEEPEPTGYAYG